jgi:hypothetical protein
MNSKQNIDFGKGMDMLSLAILMQLSDKGKIHGLWDIDKWDAFREFREKDLSLEEAQLNHPGRFNELDFARIQMEAMMKGGASFADLKRKFGDKFYLGRGHDENLLLNEGINAMWTLICGGAETAYNNANARLGVGDNNTAAAASQTALQAVTNVLFKAMDASYPTYGSSQQAVFRATFASADGNYAWKEFSIDNGNSANKNMNRLVSDQGTKVSGQSWQVTLTGTLS